MDFVEVARFASRLEAETVGHALDQYGIPFLVKSENVGLFGPGANGPLLGGASLWVPEDQIDAVRTLIRCVVERSEGTGPGAERMEEGEEPAGPHQ